MWQILLAIALLTTGPKLFRKTNWAIKAMMDFAIIILVAASVFLLIFSG